VARKSIEFTCTSCRKAFESAEYGTPLPCPHCGESLGRIAQLDQLLDQWFYPRRWRADLHEPNPYYLLEKLWTANGQGETLYQGISPQYANYDVFRNLVTRLVAKGVDEGWIELEFPDDPLDENPVYQLKFTDADRFARGVEQLFPEVDWDEQIEVPAAAPAQQVAEPATSKERRPTSIGAARAARRARRRR
jgi:predicted RNA-binding Zn-ribbon protein involved in translation (DUF1610 family)